MKLTEKPKLLLRGLALATLAFWFAAQILCVFHCNFGEGHATSSSQPRSSCHGPEASHQESPDSAPVDDRPGPSFACLTIKSAFRGDNASGLIPPQHFFSIFTAVSVALDSVPNHVLKIFIRQSWRPDLVDTREVYLGASNRSLAPPFIG